MEGLFHFKIIVFCRMLLHLCFVLVLKGHLKIVRYLFTECKCNIDKSANLKVSEHCIEKIIPRPLLDILNIFSKPDVKGVSPLHAACSLGHLEIVKYLITECNCNPNSSDNFGSTPLGYSIDGQHCEIVLYLMNECKCNSVRSLMKFYDTLQQKYEESDFLNFCKEICILRGVNASS